MASTRMIICEATTDELAREVIVKMVEHVRTLTGLIKHSILVEAKEISETFGSSAAHRTKRCARRQP
jgi:hypothetical protein